MSPACSNKPNTRSKKHPHLQWNLKGISISLSSWVSICPDETLSLVNEACLAKILIHAGKPDSCETIYTESMLQESTTPTETKVCRKKWHTVDIYCTSLSTLCLFLPLSEVFQNQHFKDRLIRNGTLFASSSKPADDLWREVHIQHTE